MKRFIPPPPPDRPFPIGGLLKWPWFSARQRGYLLEQRVKELEARVEHLEKFLIAESGR